MLKRQCRTPYKPEVKGPLDVSHFEDEFTKRPILSPDSPLILNKDVAQRGLNHAAKNRSDLFYAADDQNEDDEFGADFYFVQSPSFDEKSKFTTDTASMEL